MVKLIKHTGECDRPDDTTLPFKLFMTLRAPEFMIVAFVCLYGGTEDIVARGETVDELVDWTQEHGLLNHPRLSRWLIAGQDGVILVEGRGR